jgi:hypothetical protein
MKRFFLLFLALVILGGGGVYFYNQKHVADAPSRSTAIPSPSEQQKAKPTITTQPPISINLYCTADDIDSRISLEPAAGNVYGTLTLKNVSDKNCSINGNKFVQPTSTAKNITITKEGKPGATYITLKPNETVYSQVHYPNGPQCTDSTETKSITFAYQISASQTVTFADAQSNMDQSLTVCSSQDEKTAIEVWGIATEPLH